MLQIPYSSFLTWRPVTRFTPFLLTDTFSQWHAAPYLPCGTHSYLVPPDSSTLLVCHGPLWSVRCRTLMYINPPSQSLKPQLELFVQSSQLALNSLSAKTQPPASSQPLVSALGRLCTLVPLSPCPCVFAPCPPKATGLTGRRVGKER